MTSHKDYRLDHLGINSQEDADELQRELDIRFDQFTFHDRKVWNDQNSYLDVYAQTRTVSTSADTAGVTVYTAQTWKHTDILGFTRRLEVADLRFSDNLQVMALERAREPDAPTSLIIALLRAHIPEKYSTNGHVCDTSKSDEILFHLRQDAYRQLAEGHPTLRAIANGDRQPPHDSPSHTDLSPTEGEDTAHPNLSPHGEETQRGDSFHNVEETTPPGDTPPFDEEDFAHFNLSPTGKDTAHPNLSPHGEETQRGDSPSAPSEVNRHSHPIASLRQTRRRHTHNDHNTFKVVRF